MKVTTSGRILRLVVASLILVPATAVSTRPGRGATGIAAELPAAAVSIRPGAAERLAGSIRIRTVSPEDPSEFDGAPFQVLHEYLRQAFPLVHRQLRRETVATHSLVYTWPGAEPDLKPILMIGHLDVVPVESDSTAQWREAPFSGRISDGYVWGRGSIDNKSAVLGILEAIEVLLRDGFRPRRTVFLAFGHDEEAGGMHGAKAIAELFQQRGLAFELVLDEGGIIGDGIFPVPAPVALVGTTEKGFLSLELVARGDGGHSSVPPGETAIGVLAAALTRLQAHPLPARLDGATLELFDAIGPHLPLLQRTLFANLWITRRYVLQRLSETATTNAMIRTTIAPTIVQAGTKDNVLPTSARAVVNFRILPGDSITSVIEHVRLAVDDPRVSVRRAGRFFAEPGAVSQTTTPQFRMLERAIRSTVPGAIVAPYTVVVVTDSRHYTGLSRNLFRFQPIRLAAADLPRMHGINERIGISNYEGAIRTYRHLLLSASSR